MTAKIGTVRTAPREVKGARSGRSYIVTLTPAGLIIREKGRRNGPTALDYDAVHSLAIKHDLGADVVMQLRPRTRRRA